MSLILALDTATDIGSVAVGDGAQVLAEVRIFGRRHASLVMPAIERVLGLVAGSLDDVAEILLADGPGSFTGLRIGTATVQGIVRARDDVAVTSAPSLLAAAAAGAAVQPGPVAALYDALRGDVYGAVYEFREDRVDTLLDATLAPVATLVDRSPVAPGVAVGDGAAAYPAAVRQWTGRDPIGPPLGAPSAAALLGLRGRKGVTTPIPSVAAFEPTYGRQAEAQVKWEREHGRALPDSPGRPG